MTLLLPRQKSRKDATARTVGKDTRPLTLIALVTLLIFGAIGGRLGYLQLVAGTHNRELADENRIRLIPKPPERGKILDRKGRILAGNTFSYSVFLWPIAKTKAEWPKTLELLSKILNIPQAEIQRRLERAGYASPSLVRVAKGINWAQVVALAEHTSELEGVEVDKEAMRFYPHKELAAEVLGYIGELNEDELKVRESQGYRLGDVIGKAGVEASYEKQLRGTWGGQQVEVDGAGQVLRVLGQKTPRPGNNVQLTLDLNLQRAAEQALGNRKGAIVALDPRNGEVLALVSHPGYDPNWFARSMTQAQWNELQKREFPFVNRALQAFPPASTFKVITTTAAIESGKFPPDTVLQTYGSITAGGIAFHDWNLAGFGSLGFVRALAMSSDTFFYQIGMGIGGDRIAEWSRRYGFGQNTGIDIPGEAPGLVPDEAWKRKELEEDWYVGDTIIMSIGQGALQVSPIQLAVMFAVVANGGYKVKPHLFLDHDHSRWRQSMHLKPKTVSILKAGLREVVAGGTGQALNVASLPPVAGKSGTGEDPPRPNHTWFGGYAPANNPQIVVVAFGENSGGGGSALCSPMVGKVLHAFFNPNYKGPPPTF
jgi:penicillin-binding protein 2